MATAGAPLVAVALPFHALADTGGVLIGVMPGEEAPFDPTLLIVAVLAAVVAATATAAVLRPAWRRWIGAVVTLVLISGFGVLLALVGAFFSDWSGNHRVSWPAVVIGIAISIVGVVAAIRSARGGHPRPS